MQPTIGFQALDVVTSDQTPQFSLGTVAGAETDDGYKEYMYVKAGAAITGRGYFCQVYGDNLAIMMTTGTSGGGIGTRCGPALSAVAVGDFFWIQVRGKGPCRVGSAIPVGAQLVSSASAGVLDDGQTVGFEFINGVYIAVANVGAGATVEDIWYTYPTVGISIT